MGERTLAYHNNQTWDEYVYLNGQPLADLDNTGTWTDYIYANGQMIAMASSQRPVLHLRGTRTPDNAMCGINGAVSGVPAGIANYQIHTNDKLVMNIKQNAATYGGIFLVFNQVAADGYSGTINTTDATTQQYLFAVSPAPLLTSLGTIRRSGLWTFLTKTSKITPDSGMQICSVLLAMMNAAIPTPSASSM